MPGSTMRHEATAEVRLQLPGHSGAAWAVLGLLDGDHTTAGAAVGALDARGQGNLRLRATVEGAVEWALVVVVLGGELAGAVQVCRGALARLASVLTPGQPGLPVATLPQLARGETGVLPSLEEVQTEPGLLLRAGPPGPAMPAALAQLGALFLAPAGRAVVGRGVYAALGLTADDDAPDGEQEAGVAAGVALLALDGGGGEGRVHGRRVRGAVQLRLGAAPRPAPGLRAVLADGDHIVLIGEDGALQSRAPSGKLSPLPALDPRLVPGSVLRAGQQRWVLGTAKGRPAAQELGGRLLLLSTARVEAPPVGLAGETPLVAWCEAAGAAAVARLVGGKAEPLARLPLAGATAAPVLWAGKGEERWGLVAGKGGALHGLRGTGKSWTVRAAGPSLPPASHGLLGVSGAAPPALLWRDAGGGLVLARWTGARLSVDRLSEVLGKSAVGGALAAVALPKGPLLIVVFLPKKGRWISIFGEPGRWVLAKLSLPPSAAPVLTVERPSGPVLLAHRDGAGRLQLLRLDPAQPSRWLS